MDAREWTYRDRAGWDAGPWDGEPDKAQWTDEATGLPCLIVRNRMGALCGYVGVPAAHPWHGKDYSDRVPESQQSQEPIGNEARMSPIAMLCAAASADDQPGTVPIDCAIVVHGGLTYADRCDVGNREHGICHLPGPGEPDDVWWFGFDCSHHMDLVPQMAKIDREHGWATDGTYRGFGYVRSECALLAKQLAAVAA